MTSPEAVATAFATAVVEGRFDDLVKRYAMPLVVEFKGNHQTVPAHDRLIKLAEVVRAELLEKGVVEGVTEVLRPAVVNGDVAFVRALSRYLDANGETVTASRFGYVMRREAEDWKIMIVSAEELSGPTAEGLVAALDAE